jgi:hypothetical protein
MRHANVYLPWTKQVNLYTRENLNLFNAQNVFVGPDFLSKLPKRAYDVMGLSVESKITFTMVELEGFAGYLDALSALYSQFRMTLGRVISQENWDGLLNMHQYRICPRNQPNFYSPIKSFDFRPEADGTCTVHLEHFLFKVNINSPTYQLEGIPVKAARKTELDVQTAPITGVDGNIDDQEPATGTFVLKAWLKDATTVSIPSPSLLDYQTNVSQDKHFNGNGYRIPWIGMYDYSGEVDFSLDTEYNPIQKGESYIEPSNNPWTNADRWRNEFLQLRDHRIMQTAIAAAATPYFLGEPVYDHGVMGWINSSFPQIYYLPLLNTMQDAGEKIQPPYDFIASATPRNLIWEEQRTWKDEWINAWAEVMDVVLPEKAMKHPTDNPSEMVAYDPKADVTLPGVFTDLLNI